MLIWAVLYSSLTFPVLLRFGLNSEVALRPRQPEPAGGQPAGQSDPQKLSGGPVWVRSGFDLSGVAGGRRQWSVSDLYRLTSVKSARRQRLSSLWLKSCLTGLISSSLRSFEESGLSTSTKTKTKTRGVCVESAETCRHSTVGTRMTLVSRVRNPWEGSVRWFINAVWTRVGSIALCCCQLSGSA